MQVTFSGMEHISIDDGFELIQFRVGYILNMDGGIYLDNFLFLFQDNDSVCSVCACNLV